MKSIRPRSIKVRLSTVAGRTAEAWYCRKGRYDEIVVDVRTFEGDLLATVQFSIQHPRPKK